MTRAALYARYSSDRQNERSIDDQLALAHTIAQRAGYSVVATFHDAAVSGASTLNRPGFLALIDAAVRGAFDVLVVEDLSRAFRNEADYHVARRRLEFIGVAIHTAGGRLSRIEGSVKAMVDAMTLDTLALQVRRGLAGVVRDGRHAGGRCYGYRLVPGAPGQLAIEAAEADVVRRIFSDYAAGASPRDIAAALNREQVPGPRGGHWNASTITGSRVRRNGVLANALYDGRLIWNRQSFRKNPDTARRVSRPNPESDWMTAPAEALRIVERTLFNAVQARHQARGARAQKHQRSRAPHLLSGLIRCGACGHSYVAAGGSGASTWLRCSHRTETGLCENKRTVRRAAIEAAVLDGIARELGDPVLVAGYVREYHRRLQALHDGEGDRKRRIDRRLGEVRRDARRIAQLLVDGAPGATLTERLRELEAQRTELEAELAALPPPPIPLHPGAAEAFGRQVATLKATLASATPERRAEAAALLRNLVDRIVIRPLGHKHGPVDVEIHGRLAALLGGMETRGALVAGARYSHIPSLPTFAVTIRSR